MAEGYFVLPGTAGNYLSTPHLSGLTVAGDIEIVARVSADDWTPSTQRAIVSKPGNYSLVVRATTGYLGFSHVNAGEIVSDTTVAHGFIDGTTYWIKFTLDADNGAGSRVASFYYAAEAETEPTSWTLIQQRTIAGVLPPIASSSRLYLGSYDGGSQFWAGSLKRAIVRSGIAGTTAFDTGGVDVPIVTTATAYTSTSDHVISISRSTPTPAALSDAVLWLDVASSAADQQSLPNRGTTGSALNAQYGSGVGVDSSDPTFLPWSGENYIYLPGPVATNQIGFADSPALDITGDLQVEIDFALDTYTTANRFDLIGRNGTDPNRGWMLSINSTGTLRLIWYPSGSAASSITATSTVALPVTTAGTRYRLKATLDVNNGASGNTVTFYYDLTGGGWVQLGSPVVTAGVTSLPAITMGLNMWVAQGAVEPTGKLYGCRLLNGINGTVVAQFSGVNLVDPGASSFTATTGGTVTIGKSSSDRKTTIVTRPLMLFGSSDYLVVPDNAALDFNVGEAATIFIAYRQWHAANYSGPVGKRLSSTNTNPGWGMIQPNSLRWLLESRGGGVTDDWATSLPSPGFSAGQLIGLTYVKSGGGTNATYINTVSTPSTDTEINWTNSEPLYIGRPGTAAASFDMEFLGMAIARRALSDAEIATLVDHFTNEIYTGPPTLIVKRTTSIIYGTGVPSYEIIDQFEADVVRVRSWLDIYEADNTTIWRSQVPITDGTVTVDMSRSERRNLDVSISDIDDEIGYGPGKFWYDKILKPYRGIMLANGDTWVTPLGEFLPDNITRPHFPDVIRATCRDFVKKLVLDKFADTTTFAAGLNVGTVIQTIATNGGITKFNFASTTSVLPSSVTFERGDERWKAMEDLAKSISFEVFFNAFGYLTFRPFVDPYTAGVTYTFRTGADSNLISFSRATSDVFLFNDVVVYDPDSLIYGRATNTTPGSPTRVAAIGRRLKKLESSFVADNAAANALAAAYLKVSSLEQYDVSVDALIVPWLEAGDAVELNLPDAEPGDPIRYLLTNFSIPLGLGSMAGNAKRVTIVS